MNWIKLDDEKPKDDDYYLIWPHGKYAGVGATFWPYGNENGHVSNTFEMESEYGEITQVDVTHWMELPGDPEKQHEGFMFERIEDFEDAVEYKVNTAFREGFGTARMPKQ